MIIFLPIKPNYAFKIIKGEKKYEFRKNTFTKDIDIAIIYATSPEKKIIGCFKIEEILVDDPKIIWKRCKKYSGIKKEDYFKYFSYKNIATALKISKKYILEKFIDPKKIWPDFKVPQSFKYTNRYEINTILNFEPNLYHWIKTNTNYPTLFA